MLIFFCIFLNELGKRDKMQGLHVFSQKRIMVIGVRSYLKISFIFNYSETCLKRQLKNSQNKCLKATLFLNAGQKYCSMLHRCILQFF